MSDNSTHVTDSSIISLVSRKSQPNMVVYLHVSPQQFREKSEPIGHQPMRCDATESPLSHSLAVCPTLAFLIAIAYNSCVCAKNVVEMMKGAKKQKKEVVLEPESESESEEEQEEFVDEVDSESVDEDFEGVDNEEEDDEEEEEEDVDAEDEESGDVSDVVAGTKHEDVVDDLRYDLFNLSASSFHPLRWKNAEDRERVLAQTSTRVAQLLYKK
jgi:hypothetical protein